MMFLLDLAFAVDVLALGLGGYFLVWAASHEGAGKSLANSHSCFSSAWYAMY